MEKSIHVVQYYFSLATFTVFVWINDLKTIIRYSWEVIGGDFASEQSEGGEQVSPSNHLWNSILPREEKKSECSHYIISIMSCSLTFYGCYFQIDFQPVVRKCGIANRPAVCESKFAQ